ncbi:Nucleotid_trans domain-containing protein, partial [Cephalotus follicularis]
HLVIVSMDQKAYDCCLSVHPHCYALRTKGINFSSQACHMTPDYLDMMWKRIDFLASILVMGYNFVFTVPYFILLSQFIYHNIKICLLVNFVCIKYFEEYYITLRELVIVNSSYFIITSKLETHDSILCVISIKVLLMYDCVALFICYIDK